MPSTYTVNLGIEKPATGEQSGTWGDTTNVNFDILDQAINGAERVTLTSAGSSGSPNTLQITNGATSDGRNKWIEFYSSGDLGGSVYVQLDPNDAEKIVFVRNSLASSRSVLLFQGTYNSGRDLEVPAGVDMVVKFDGGGASAATVTDVFTKLRATEITTPTLTATTADINGGTIDNSVIGGSTAAAVTGTTVVANTSLNIAGDGATVTGIKDEDNMASNSATKLATQQSIKAYVDSQVGTVDTWAEVLANGATSGSTNPEVTAGQALKTNTINETSAGSGVTIDSVLLKDDVVNATDVETGSISANDGTASATIANSTGVMTIASSVLTTADINAGTIDNSTIGGSTPAVGTFTQVNVDNFTLDGTTLALSSGAMTISGADDLTLDFESDINIDANGGDIRLKDNGTVFGVFSSTNNDLNIRTTATDEDIVFKGSDGGSEITALTLDMSDSGTANFGGAVVLGGSLIKTGDMTLDASGDIILDADGGDFKFRDGGAGFFTISNSSLDTVLKVEQSNEDFIIKGNDGGSEITALTLDMSAAGYATFNNHVQVNDRIVGANNLILVTHDSSEKIHMDNTGFIKFETAGGERFRIASDGAAQLGFAGAALQQADSQALSIITPASGGGQGIALKRLDTNADQALGEISWSNNTQDGQANIRVKTAGAANTTDMAFDISNAGTVTQVLNFDGSASGAATFNSSIIMSGVGSLTEVNENFCISGTDADHAGLIMATHAILPAEVGAEAAANVIDIGANGNEFKSLYLDTSIIASNALSINAGTILTLDAGSGVIDFDDNGTNIGRIENSSSDFKLESRVQDKDIVFVGNDGGSGITALRLDMSEAGQATFNNGISNVFVTGSITPLIVRATNPTSTDKWGMYAQYRSASVNGDGAGMSLGLHNASGAEAEYVYFGAIIEDNTTGSQDGSFIIAPVANGSRNEVVRVTSTNQVLIDLTSIPTAGNGHDSKLFVNQTGSEYDGITFGSGFNVSTIANNAYDLVLTANAYPANTGSVQAIRFKTGTSGGGGPNQVGQIDQNGMHFGTDTAADTGLDDYEEGTWTPAFGAETSNPTIGYNAQIGHYTKVGRKVNVNGYIITTSRSGGSGTLTVDGLPFTVASGIAYFSATIGFNYNWNTPPLNAGAQGGTTHLLLYQDARTNAVSGSADIVASGNTYFYFNCTYYV